MEYRYIEYPLNCPICNAETVFEGEFLICPNPNCEGKIIGNLQKWIETMEIDEAGEAFLEDIRKLGVNDVADLYTLSPKALMKLPGYGEVKANKVIEEIHKKKTIKLVKFLAGLNIHNLGIGTWDVLYKAGYDTIEKILSISSATSLIRLQGIGDITAKAIVRAVNTPKFQTVVAKLLKVVNIEEKIQGKLTGKSFCFTGEISIKRNDAFKLVEQAGGEVKTSVSKGLSYLVQSDPNSNSTKAQKARKYGTKVIGEREFFELVDFSFDKLL